MEPKFKSTLSIDRFTTRIRICPTCKITPLVLSGAKVKRLQPYCTPCRNNYNRTQYRKSKPTGYSGNQFNNRLTDEVVLSILFALASRRSVIEIAESANINIKRIYNIRAGLVYKRICREFWQSQRALIALEEKNETIRRNLAKIKATQEAYD